MRESSGILRGGKHGLPVADGEGACCCPGQNTIQLVMSNATRIHETLVRSVPGAEFVALIII